MMDLRSTGSIRANTASMTEMVSAAVFPASLASSVPGSGGVKRRVVSARQLIAENSREIVDFGRPIACAIAPIEWPKALAKPICSLSSPTNANSIAWQHSLRP